MQGEQRERLIALAAQVAVESDPVKFHVLVLELNKMLNEKNLPIPGNGKTLPEPPNK
ncbi:MAG: hypothetical protein ABR881_17040 [Candidatus Sulfotelmatobacter sp.]